MAAFNVHKTILEAEKEGYDGIVIASFGDPGIEAAKEIVEIPVVGITESSYSLARLLCTKFLVVVSADTAVPRQVRYLKALGYPDHQFDVRSIGLTIIDVMSDRMNIPEVLAKSCGPALKETGAELVVLGCSGFSGFRKDLEDLLQIPVIDPIIAGVNVCESLIRMGLKQSKQATYKNPPVFTIKE
ncbi:aspartate/glutamate racemase family protein [Candidatus Bathyarchaeota archaeon]|nr:aspartate/glutamate racemase family protein [Candidatus Bathyarchaeota archaeon]